MITFENVDIFGLRVKLEGIQVKFIYEGHWVKVKATVANKARNSLFLRCKTSIGDNSDSVEGRAVKFACSMGFSAMADRVVWPPSLLRDRNTRICGSFVSN